MPPTSVIILNTETVLASANTVDPDQTAPEKKHSDPDQCVLPSDKLQD